MTVTVETKYNIGDIVRIRIKGQHDPRTEVEATIIGFVIGKKLNVKEYKVEFESSEYMKSKGHDNTICFVTEDAILELLHHNNNLDEGMKAAKTGTKNNQPIILVNRTEYQKRVLKCIASDEINTYFGYTIFADKPECKQAMIHGICVASMLISDCSSWIV